MSGYHCCGGHGGHFDHCRNGLAGQRPSDDVKPYTPEELDHIDRVLSLMDAGTLDEAISPLAWAGVRRLVITVRAGLADREVARTWFTSYAEVWGDGWDGIHPLSCAVGHWCDSWKKAERPGCTCGLDDLLARLGISMQSSGLSPSVEAEK